MWSGGVWSRSATWQKMLMVISNVWPMKSVHATQIVRFVTQRLYIPQLRSIFRPLMACCSKMEMIYLAHRINMNWNEKRYRPLANLYRPHNLPFRLTKFPIEFWDAYYNSATTYGMISVATDAEWWTMAGLPWLPPSLPSRLLVQQPTLFCKD